MFKIGAFCDKNAPFWLSSQQFIPVLYFVSDLVWLINGQVYPIYPRKTNLKLYFGEREIELNLILMLTVIPLWTQIKFHQLTDKFKTKIKPISGVLPSLASYRAFIEDNFWRSVLWKTLNFDRKCAFKKKWFDQDWNQFIRIIRHLIWLPFCSIKRKP